MPRRTRMLFDRATMYPLLLFFRINSMPKDPLKEGGMFKTTFFAADWRRNDWVLLGGGLNTISSGLCFV